MRTLIPSRTTCPIGSRGNALPCIRSETEGGLLYAQVPSHRDPQRAPEPVDLAPGLCAEEDWGPVETVRSGRRGRRRLQTSEACRQVRETPGRVFAGMRADGLDAVEMGADHGEVLTEGEHIALGEAEEGQ